MGESPRCSLNDGKCATNISTRGYDVADMDEMFDGRFTLTRADNRHDYGEARFNMLSGFKDRIVNITFTTRAGKYHLISVRDASKTERAVYHARHAAP
jgi:uncharacterized DUF497 family protein